MALSREDSGILVERILRGEKFAFEEFYEQYNPIVIKFTGKYWTVIDKVTNGLYDFEDVHNEVWGHVYAALSSYRSDLGAMTTWLYKVCPSACARILAHWQRAKRECEDGMTSLDIMVGDDESSSFIDFIADPSAIFDSNVCTEETVYEYVYIVKEFVDGLKKDRLKMIYMHQARGMTMEASSAILGVSRQAIQQTRCSLAEKLAAQKAKYEKKNIDTAKAALFAANLLSPLSDDELSENTGHSLSTIKICREVMRIAGLQ